MKNYYCYILYSSKLDRFYIGSTGNLADRLERHNRGSSKATKPGIPWELKYSEEFTSRSEALKREYQLKSWKNRQRLIALIQKT